MTDWTPYPNDKAGSYAYHEGLTLAARHDGAWAVWDTSGRITSVTSILAPVIYPEDQRNLESAKAKAESAAHRMITQG